MADAYGACSSKNEAVHLTRTTARAGAPHTGLGGSSLCGLVSLYLGLRYPCNVWQIGSSRPPCGGKSG